MNIPMPPKPINDLFHPRLTSPDAPTYLFEAGRIYERAGDLENAAATWQRMMDEYPSAELSYRGLFLAGISYYRLGKFEEALQFFNEAWSLALLHPKKQRLTSGWARLLQH